MFNNNPYSLFVSSYFKLSKYTIEPRLARSFLQLIFRQFWTSRIIIGGFFWSIYNTYLLKYLLNGLKLVGISQSLKTLLNISKVRLHYWQGKI